MKNALVAGAGGFIGGHLVNRLVEEGHTVLAVDIKPLDEWNQVSLDTKFNIAECDLGCLDYPMELLEGQDEVYMLAADMGGMGFIENNKLACMLTVLPSTNMLMAASAHEVERFFYASSACVYKADRQDTVDARALKESDAYPAMPEDGYGWEKLFTERMCRHFTEDVGLPTRIARYHNVYGPQSTYDGGREKAPAAICRKVIEAVKSGNHTIEIWGDGEQTRSFMEVDDCVRGTLMLMRSPHKDPLNIGSSELVTVNQLVAIAEDIAGQVLMHSHDLTAPQGVRGRNSDNTKIKELFGWEPSISLRTGMERLYAWVWDEMSK